MYDYAYSTAKDDFIVPAKEEYDMYPKKIAGFYFNRGWTEKQIANYFNTTIEKVQEQLSFYDRYFTKKDINKRLENSCIKNHIVNISQKETYQNSTIKNKYICSCGHVFQITYSNILNNMQYHEGIFVCPTIKSYGEYLVKNYLNNCNLKYEKEYTFKDFKDIKSLRFDFAIFKDGKLLGVIEHDGKYHARKHSSKIHKHDKMKDEYCKQNNIPLLRINTYKNIDKLIDNFILINLSLH